MALSQVYPISTIPVPSDVQAKTNELFDFDDEYLVQNDIRQIDYVRVYDRSNDGNIATKDHWLFQMNDIAGQSFYNPAQSYLKMNFRIRRSNNGAGVVDLYPQTFASDLRCAFRRIRFALGGQTVTDIPDYSYAWAAIDNCMWVPQYTKTVGRMMGCFPTRVDQPGNAPVVSNNTLRQAVESPAAPGTAGEAHHSNNYQNSLGKRQYLSCGQLVAGDPPLLGAEISVFIPLYSLSPALEFMDKNLAQIQWELELWCSDDNIRCYCAKPSGISEPYAQFEFVDTGIELWAKRVTPTDTARLVLVEKMNRGIDFKTKFADLNVFRVDVPSNPPGGFVAGARVFIDERINVTASRPTKAIVAFQAKHNTNQQSYEYDEFFHAFCTDISMLVNNVQVPTESIQSKMDDTYVFGIAPVNFPPLTNNIGTDIARPYYEYLKHCGNFKAPYLSGFQNGAGDLNKWDWFLRAPLFCFDLSSREISQWAGSASEIRVKATRTLPALVTDQPDDYWMWVFIWTERELAIHMENWNSYISIA